jgi:homoserine O-acetyltransferase
LKIETKKEIFTNPLYLESGRILEPYEIVYETYGEMNEAKDNIIIICHALTGSHHVSGRYANEAKAGWWDNLIGDGKAVDTKKYFVICTNVIGSCYGSTNPLSKIYPTDNEYRLKFPVITISDMVKAQKILFNRLGIEKVKAIIGGSMGGMQALCFAIEYPNFADTIIPLATTYATQPWAIAFNKIAQTAIVNDKDFKNGNYNPNDIKKNGLVGMAVGRMAGHISYLASDSMQKKFGRNYAHTDGLYELFGRFEVERYLDYNGFNFPKYFDPLSYLYITKTINIFNIARNNGSVEEALDKIESNLFLISFKKDMLFFPEEMEFIHKTMQQRGKKSFYYEVDSDYGHDAFLVEVDKFSGLICDILDKKVEVK